MKNKSKLAGMMIAFVVSGINPTAGAAVAAPLDSPQTGFTVISPYTTKAASCEAEYYRKRSDGMLIEFQRSGPLAGSARTFKQVFQGFTLEVSLDRNCEDEDRQCWGVDLVSRVSKNGTNAQSELPLQGDSPWFLKTNLSVGLEEVRLNCRAEDR
jgi:hypothetical protein